MTFDDTMTTVSGVPVGGTEPITISFANDTIDAITPGGRSDTLLSPGLIDIHCHGAGGAQFGSAGGAQFGSAQSDSRTAAEFHHRRGTTSVMGSLISADPARLAAGVENLASLVADDTVIGIHLEGPYLATACCGAHDPTLLRPPDIDELRALHQISPITMVTYAPELPGADEFLDALLELGIKPAIGHTAGSGETVARHIQRAAAVGAEPVVTHLFNGMPPFHHRHPGPAGAGLAAAVSGMAFAEIIADGVHLDAATIALTMAAAPKHVVLISDATAAAGLGDGVHAFGARAVEVAGHRSVIAGTDVIAGSVITSIDAVRFAIDCGISVADAFAAASTRPADLMGRPDLGRLAVGARADILELDAKLNIRRVWRQGRQLAPR